MMIVLQDISPQDAINKIDYYKDLFISEKVIGVNKYSLNDELIFSFIKNLTDSDTNEVIISSSNEHIGQDRIDSSDIKKLEDFKYYNMHSDISKVEQPNLNICRLIGMKMEVFKCDPSYGKTFFLDREKMLHNTPLNIRNWMSQIQILPYIGQRLNANGYYTPGEDYDGHTIWPMRSMPGILTHPVTSIENFAFTSYTFGVYGRDLSLENEYREFIKEYLSDNDNWWEWQWSEGKWILWDNYNLLHTYSGGWKDGERVFTRFQSGFIWPFYKVSK